MSREIESADAAESTGQRLHQQGEYTGKQDDEEMAVAVLRAGRGASVSWLSWLD